MANDIQKYILKHKNEIIIDCSNEIFTYNLISELIGMDLEEYITLNLTEPQMSADGSLLETSNKNYNNKDKYIIKNGDVDVDISNLCKNSNFPLDFFIKYPQLPRIDIEKNKSITLENITNTNIAWDYNKLLAYNPNITLKFILDNPQFKCLKPDILKYPEITWDYLMEEIINNQ
jgi:hypothetical protein